MAGSTTQVLAIKAQLAVIRRQCDVLSFELDNELMKQANSDSAPLDGSYVASMTSVTAANAAIIAATGVITTAIAALP